MFLILFLIIFAIICIICYIFSYFNIFGYTAIVLILVICSSCVYYFCFGSRTNINDSDIGRYLRNHNFITIIPTTLWYDGNKGVYYFTDEINLNKDLNDDYSHPTKYCHKLTIDAGLIFRVTDVYYFTDIFNGSTIKIKIKLASDNKPIIIDGIKTKLNDRSDKSGYHWERITNFDKYNSIDFNVKEIDPFVHDFFNETQDNNHPTTDDIKYKTVTRKHDVIHEIAPGSYK